MAGTVARGATAFHLATARERNRPDLAGKYPVSAPYSYLKPVLYGYCAVQHDTQAFRSGQGLRPAIGTCMNMAFTGRPEVLHGPHDDKLNVPAFRSQNGETFATRMWLYWPRQ
jgi:hypothetical protein